MTSRPEAGDGVGEVQVDAPAARAHAAALVAHLLGVARGDVAGHQVAEARVLALQVVVPFLLGDLVGRSGVAGLDRDPDAAVVAQRLRHQGQLGLVVAAHRDAGGVDLGEARVGQERAPAVGPPDGGGVAALGVGREVEHVAVAARGQDHGVGGVRLDLSGDQVPGHDAPGRPVGHHQVQHLVAGVHGHLAQVDLAGQGLVGAEEELLAGLAPGVEGARDLGAAEGAVVEQPAVLPGEGDALGHALVDDVDAQLGQPVHVGLAGAVVASLDGVVEQAVDAVAVVAVVLGRVDPALGGDGVGPAGRVLVAEAADPVARARPGWPRPRRPPGPSRPR